MIEISFSKQWKKFKISNIFMLGKDVLLDWCLAEKSINEFFFNFLVKIIIRERRNGLMFLCVAMTKLIISNYYFAYMRYHIFFLLILS